MTSRHDWYRKSTWSAADRDDFETRLARARRSSRSQYLLIQAEYLLQSGILREAILLVDRVITEYPERCNMSRAYTIRAKCCAELNHHDNALASFRSAVQAERAYPNVRTNVYLDFAEYVVRYSCDNSFHEALLAMDEMPQTGTQFPVHDYLYHALKACLLQSPNSDDARQHAELARMASAKLHSGFWKHPTIGLVEQEPEWLKIKLDKILVE